jgi:tetratricopeptide (TPR) repeat protein
MNNQYKTAISQAQQAFVLGNYEQALNKARMAFLLNPGAAGAYVLAGSACFVLGRMEEAENFYRKAVALDEENGEHHFNLGNCLTAQNRLQEALNCYANAEIHKCSDKTRQKLYFAMGKINQQSGKAQDALLNYKKAESIPGPNPDMAEILLNRTEIYVSLTDWENAENCAMQLKLLLPGEFKSYQLLFQILLQQKKIKQAEEILVEGECYCPYTPENRIEFAFDHAMIHCFMAELEPENQEKHFDGALSWLDKVEQLSDLPKDVRTEVQLTRTEIFLKLGRMEQAVKMAATIAALTDPDLTEYIEKARFLLVDCCKQQHDLDGMIIYAAQLKTSENLLYRHHGYYCEFWAAKEQTKSDPQQTKRTQDLYDRAIAYYKKSAMENVGDLLSYTYRAQIYADMGKYEKAEQMCEMLPEDAKVQLKAHINNCRKAQS